MPAQRLRAPLQLASASFVRVAGSFTARSLLQYPVHCLAAWSVCSGIPCCSDCGVRSVEMCDGTAASPEVSMKLVLVKDVPSLGKVGDVKEVANGYARNYLLPKGMAVEATAGQLQRLQVQRDAEARRADRVRKDNDSLATRLADVTVTLKAKVGDQSRLYGSITSKDLADAIQKQAHIEIDRHKIELDEPIRTLGTHQVPIHIAGDLHPKVTVVIEEA